MDKEEHYIATNFELRDGEDKQVHIQGYALTFDSLSEDMGFREIIRKGALDNTDMTDVIFNFNHDNDKVLARNNKSDGIGSLVLTVDDKGLFFDAIPTNTSYSNDLIENLRNGVLGKCSFRFSLDYEDNEAYVWDWDFKGTRGYDLRTINKIKTIRDVSIVTYPAYEATSSSIYVRAKENNEKEILREKEIAEKEKLSLELELL